MPSTGWLPTVLLLVFGALAHVRADPPLNCLNETLQKTTAAGQWPKVTLPANYKVVVRYTNLLQNATAKVTEFNYTTGFVVRKEEAGVETTFIRTAGRLLQIKGDECKTVNSSDLQAIYGLPDEFRALFKNNASNLEEIVSGVVGAAYDGIRGIDTAWVDGVQTATWLACANQTDKRPAVEVDVQILGGGDESLKIYSNVSRPLVASVRLITYQITGNTSKVLSHLWLNVVEVENVKPDEEFDAVRPPRGVYCEGLPAARLPTALPLKFEANVEYVDTRANVTDTVELMYDGENKIVSFALDFDSDTDIPFVQSETSMQLGKARVYQDFVTGFEYVMSKDGRVCRTVRPINSTWNDIEVVDAKLNLRDPTDVFFNITHEAAYFAGQVRESGALFDLFVSRKVMPNDNTKDYIVVELLFAADGWRVDSNVPHVIHSIVQYHKKADHSLYRTTTTRFNSLTNNTLVGTSWSKHSAFTCLHEGTVDNFFYLKIADHTIDELQSYGYENVESALVEAVAKTANISVLRISQFLLKQVNKQLYACFLLAEKNNGTPAQTQYLRPEETVAEVQKILNDTLRDHQITVSVVTDKAKTVQVSVQSLGVMSASEDHPPAPPTYTGYSSGSMFILGIFMFIFGAGAAVGGYVFYTRRQSIRGIAYQVFE
ncbi:hypothetical protein M3Y99_01064500 [Aphelenchoides fujianensis]|nr:hypothetical protein M3Y99_01064500 [Aphelenchoides fujianensis]